MSNTKFSIIIPVYNAAKHIEDCLESCLNQTPFKVGINYEIICINDGSSDNSLKILAEYKKRGVTVISQENCGVSVTRNKGLDIARGEYIWFVDSDDAVRTNVLSGIYYLLKSCNADGCAFRTKIVSESFEICDAEDFRGLLNIVNAPPQMNNAFSVIITKTYLNKHNIRFNTTITYGEDTLFVFYLRLYKHKFIYFDNELYFYRQVSTSAMHQKSKSALEKSFNAQLKMLAEYKSILDNWDAKLYAGDAKPQERYYWMVQNILFLLLRYDKARRLEIFNYLKCGGHYPYPILWSRLIHNSNSKTTLLTNLFSLLFPLEWYYRIIMKLLK